jgi:hypothetical protein
MMTPGGIEVADAGVVVAVVIDDGAVVAEVAEAIDDGAVVVGAGAATKLSVIVVMQVTALPPPVAVPLHWLTVTGSANVAPVTVQPTVVSPL